MIGAPTWQRLGESFEFRWPEHRITLSNFRESSGDLKAELRPEVAEGEGWAPIAGLTILNLMSARTRSDTARALTARDDTFPWHDAIEAVAVIAVREWRRGGPFVRLSEVEAPLHIRYLVDRIIPFGETAVIFGDGESGKSLFAMFLAVSVASGVALPRGIGPDGPGNVAYLDWESDPEEHSRRLRKICRGLDLDVPTNIWYRQCHRPVHEEAAMLATELAERNTDLTIIDSLAPACGDDPSAPGAAIATMNALRSLGGSRLAIGHVNRTDREKVGPNQTVFGSVFWRNLTRSMWQLVPSQDAGRSGSVPFALHNRKSNNAARERWPLGFEYVFTSDGIGIEPYEVRATDGLSEGAPTAARIRDVLKSGAMNTTDLAKALGMEHNAIRATCGRMSDVIQLEAAIPGRNGKPALWGLSAEGQGR